MCVGELAVAWLWVSVGGSRDLPIEPVDHSEQSGRTKFTEL
jgi:hypothetical protein